VGQSPSVSEKQNCKSFGNGDKEKREGTKNSEFSWESLGRKNPRHRTRRKSRNCVEWRKGGEKKKTNPTAEPPKKEFLLNDGKELAEAY